METAAHDTQRALWLFRTVDRDGFEASAWGDVAGGDSFPSQIPLTPSFTPPCDQLASRHERRRA